MEKIKNIAETIKNMPRKTKIVVGLVMGIFLIIIVIAIIITNRVTMESTTLVDVTNFEEVSDIPKGYRDVVEQLIGNMIKNNKETSGLVFSEAVIRDGTYSEKEDENVVTAKFIVDIPELEYSFDVTAIWPKGVGGGIPEDPNVVIECPYYLDVIYKNKKCIVGSPEQQIMRYLPYYGRLDNGQRFGVSLQQYNNEFYLAVEVKSCGDKAMEEAAMVSTKGWIKSIYMDPNDFVINVSDICGRGNK